MQLYLFGNPDPEINSQASTFLAALSRSRNDQNDTILTSYVTEAIIETLASGAEKGTMLDYQTGRQRRLTLGKGYQAEPKGTN